MSAAIQTERKERPILMHARSVRGILEGRKTQTRRIVRAAPNSPFLGIVQRDKGPRFWFGAAPQELTSHEVYCPHGKPLDWLWVRETWKFADWTEDEGYPFIGYAADNSQRLIESEFEEEWGDRLADIWAELSEPSNYNIDSRAADRRWRPSIHMPRWASRLTLEITDVRVERVQDISARDAQLEGVIPSLRPGYDVDIDGELTLCGVQTIREQFRRLWDDTNGKGAWERNDWVWVVEFARVA